MHDIRWVINLGNSICGVSLLVLPYCFSQCGVLLGVILLSFSALLTTWSCHLLLENVFTCKTASYEGIAKELYGRVGKLAIEISSTTLNIGCCSAFFVIISDLSPGVISWATGSGPITPSMRIVILTSLGLTVILPLSLVRNLEPLNFISIASMMFYISLTVQLFGWAIHTAFTSSELFENIHLVNFSGIFRVLPIYALAFSCHLQLMAMTREVVGEVKDGMGEELGRMKWISRGAVSLVGVVYGSVSMFGHIAFCNYGVRADVLSNFNDGLMAQVTRCGFAVSVLLSFPFIVNPCRATLYSLIYGRTDKHIPSNKHFVLTFGIVLIAFIVAVTTPNVAVVVGLTGAISGAIICYLFPSLSYLYNNKINHSRKQKRKAYTLVIIGFILLTAGTMSALISTGSTPSHRQNVQPLLTTSSNAQLQHTSSNLQHDPDNDINQHDLDHDIDSQHDPGHGIDLQHGLKDDIDSKNIVTGDIKDTDSDKVPAENTVDNQPVENPVIINPVLPDIGQERKGSLLGELGGIQAITGGRSLQGEKVSENNDLEEHSIVQENEVSGVKNNTGEVKVQGTINESQLTDGVQDKGSDDNVPDKGNDRSDGVKEKGLNDNTVNTGSDEESNTHKGPGDDRSDDVKEKGLNDNTVNTGSDEESHKGSGYQESHKHKGSDYQEFKKHKEPDNVQFNEHKEPDYPVSNKHSGEPDKRLDHQESNNHKGSDDVEFNEHKEPDYPVSNKHKGSDEETSERSVDERVTHMDKVKHDKFVTTHEGEEMMHFQDKSEEKDQQRARRHVEGLAGRLQQHKSSLTSKMNRLKILSKSLDKMKKLSTADQRVKNLKPSTKRTNV